MTTQKEKIINLFRPTFTLDGKNYTGGWHCPIVRLSPKNASSKRNKMNKRINRV